MKSQNTEELSCGYSCGTSSGTYFLRPRSLRVMPSRGRYVSTMLVDLSKPRLSFQENWETKRATTKRLPAAV